MKKSVKDQTARAFQVGGYNPPSVPQQPYTQPTQVNPQTGTYVLPGTGIAGYQIPTGAPTGFTPYGGATPYFQPVQFTGAQYQTALQTTNLPTFAETVGQRAGQYDELRTYINDAGQTLQIPFKDGRPIYPIPEGYRPIGDQPAPEEEQTTVDPVVGETTVRDEGGGDRDVSVSGTGYKGLSTTRGTGTGGLSAAAEKARTDLGITGYAGIPGGGIVGGLANAFGFDVPTAFGKAPQSGMTGTLDQATLEAVAKGQFVGATGQSAIGLSQQQALNVMEYQQNYGVTLNGVFGYKPGNINPTTGTAVGNHGMTVDSAFAGNKVTAPGAAYASISDMIDTISKGTKSGWRGGYVSQDTYNNKMTPAQQANYDNFDPSHKNAKNEAKADAALEGITGRGEEDATKGEIAATEAAIESMTSGKGIPDSVQAEIDAAMAAHEAKSGKGDSPSSPDVPAGIGGGAGVPSTSGTYDGPASPAQQEGFSREGGPGGEGGSGSGSGCFAAGTKFFMYDGSLKPVEDIKVGDVMMDGGKVRLSIIGDGSNSDWYMYGATKVTGSHAVKEQGVWKFTRDAENAVPAETEDLLYTIVNTYHRMIAEDKVVYADYDMVDEDGIEEELLEMMNLQEVVKKAA